MLVLEAVLIIRSQTMHEVWGLGQGGSLQRREWTDELSVSYKVRESDKLYCTPWGTNWVPLDLG